MKGFCSISEKDKMYTRLTAFLPKINARLWNDLDVTDSGDAELAKRAPGMVDTIENTE